jgi:hypothetical protein
MIGIFVSGSDIGAEEGYKNLQITPSSINNFRHFLYSQGMLNYLEKSFDWVMTTGNHTKYCLLMSG